jgi:hypothetical protein
MRLPVPHTTTGNRDAYAARAAPGLSPVAVAAVAHLTVAWSPTHWHRDRDGSSVPLAVAKVACSKSARVARRTVTHWQARTGHPIWPSSGTGAATMMLARKQVDNQCQWPSLSADQRHACEQTSMRRLRTFLHHASNARPGCRQGVRAVDTTSRDSSSSTAARRRRARRSDRWQRRQRRWWRRPRQRRRRQARGTRMGPIKRWGMIVGPGNQWATRTAVKSLVSVRRRPFDGKI